MLNHRYLYKYVQLRLSGLKSAHYSLRLNYQDWEDLKQDITIRVFKKIKLRDPKRPYKPYVNQIIQNAFLNWGRNHFRWNIPERVNYLAYRSVRFPNQLKTKIDQDDMGIEQVVYEPDMMETQKRDPILVKEIMSKIETLPRAKKRVITRYLREGNWGQMVSFKTYQSDRIVGLAVIEEIKQAMEC